MSRGAAVALLILLILAGAAGALVIYKLHAPAESDTQPPGPSVTTAAPLKPGETTQPVTADIVELSVGEVEYEGKRIRVEEFFIVNPLTGDKQRARLYYMEGTWPALIMVPGRGGDSEIFEKGNGALYAASKGFLVVTFDPLGRGESEGEPNDYGRLDQATLYQLYLLAKQRGDGRVGVLSFSFGVAMVSGALADYDMPIELWVDWEGPSDRIFAQVYCGEIPREQIRSVPDEELDRVKEEIWQKIQSGYSGEPGSCYDNAYWEEREAVRLIERVSASEVGLYVRLQSDRDHVQPNYDHSILMVNTMAGLGFRVRLNYGPENVTYDRRNITLYLYPTEREVESIVRAVDIAYDFFYGRPKPYPIYVTIVMHNEDPPTNPDFVANPGTYLQWRNQLVKFAKLLSTYGAAFDWQSEWNFLEATRRYDVGEVRTNTDGMNVVQFLNSLGFSIDPHSHERTYNYADVAHLLTLLGVQPSSVVGGFLYYPPDNRQGWEKFRSPLRGNVFPDAEWKGDILWGAATAGHKGPDLFASGVWRPKDRYHFITHDPSGALIYVGSYKRSSQILGGLPELVRLVEEGRLEPGKMYTVSIFVPQGLLNDDFIAWFEENVLRPLQLYEEMGVIRWATIPEVARIWLTDYGGEPNIYIPEEDRETIEGLFSP